MNVYINSKLENIPDNITTVDKLLEYLKIPATGTGVGINNRLIIAKNWPVTHIQDEDHIMIITAAYGG